ncbi:hypothetical protein FRZ44_25620 [Hypericibacter terrae]|uniref:Uncharacterized protein n=1 Tax=Hypericibacter terrae TaxID=2602015 RepID=A0A5J6MQX0_9PROT|nr:hypothetical protein FRZ44_25620 [Hypericibacter terrae]
MLSASGISRKIETKAAGRAIRARPPACPARSPGLSAMKGPVIARGEEARSFERTLLGMKEDHAALKRAHSDS